MKKDLKNITLKNLALLASSSLIKHKVSAVLTGGACVSIFSDNKYQSLDLDFVTNAVDVNRSAIKEAMREIGFERAAEGFFESPNCRYIIEFISPPLAVGSEPVKNILTIKSKIGELKLLSPTDCVKDRLAAYYHWDDLQSLEQALMVAKKQKVDFKELHRWSKVECCLRKYNRFVKEMKRSCKS